MTSSLRQDRKDAAASLRRARSVGFVAALSMLCCIAVAKPHVPSSDDVVLATAVAGSQSRAVRTLRSALAANPRDLQVATQLARVWLDTGRREGDPRFLSYAQATLEPWIARADAPADVLVLAASALQSLHRFDEAQALLDRALQADPQHAQAWLTTSTLLQVRGEFAAAQKACGHLVGTVDHRIALACLASAHSMSGRLAESYRALLQVVTPSRPLGGAEQAWLLGMLGEMAVRLGDSGAAERHFESALLADPQDPYVRGELADLYLRESRFAAVIELLKGRESQDALLLRLAIAEKNLGTTAGAHWAALYEDRYRVAQQNRDDTHLREHARYLLDVRGDARGALLAAERNWRAQREPADIRIYRRASMAAAGSLDAIDSWIAANRYQDEAL